MTWKRLQGGDNELLERRRPELYWLLCRKRLNILFVVVSFGVWAPVWAAAVSVGQARVRRQPDGTYRWTPRWFADGVLAACTVMLWALVCVVRRQRRRVIDPALVTDAPPNERWPEMEWPETELPKAERPQRAVPEWLKLRAGRAATVVAAPALAEIAYRIEPADEPTLVFGSANRTPAVLAVTRDRTLLLPLSGAPQRVVDVREQARLAISSPKLHARLLGRRPQVTARFTTSEIRLVGARVLAGHIEPRSLEPAPQLRTLGLPRLQRRAQNDTVAVGAKRLLRQVGLLPSLQQGPIGLRDKDGGLRKLRYITHFPVARPVLLWCALILTALGVLGGLSPKLFPLPRQAQVAVARVQAVDACVARQPEQAANAVRRLAKLTRTYGDRRFTDPSFKSIVNRVQHEVFAALGFGPDFRRVMELHPEEPVSSIARGTAFQTKQLCSVSAPDDPRLEKALDELVASADLVTSESASPLTTERQAPPAQAPLAESAAATQCSDVLAGSFTYSTVRVQGVSCEDASALILGGGFGAHGFQPAPDSEWFCEATNADSTAYECRAPGGPYVTFAVAG